MKVINWGDKRVKVFFFGVKDLIFTLNKKITILAVLFLFLFF